MQRETIIARDTLKRLLAKVLFVLVQALQDQVNGGGSQGLDRSANRSTGTGRAGKYVGDIGDYAKFRTYSPTLKYPRPSVNGGVKRGHRGGVRRDLWLP